jgi:aryl-alcohol dehydrogenase-like predicted oxidoreductase
MQFVRMGSTGTQVSRLCLGCMSFGGMADWTLNEDASMPILRKAVEAGINFFDTSDMYSLGASEEVTGRALREFANRDEIVLATKVYYPLSQAPNMGGLSRKHVIQGCEASLRRLGVDTIDLYYIHRFDPAVPIDETLAALDELVRWGKVRYIGASSGPAWQMAQALSVSERNGWARFVAMQNHYNLVYREEEREMIPLCVGEGVGIVPWSPLARGMLARTRPADAKVTGAGTARAEKDSYSVQLYDSTSDWDVVAAVERLAKQRGVAMAEVALAWLLARPGVSSAIVGATKLDHLDVAVRAVGLQLTADQAATLEAPYRPHGVRGFVAGETRPTGAPQRS